MIKFKRSHIRLLVNDFKSCFKFYRDILELPVRYGDENAIYGEFKSEGVHIALFVRDMMAEVTGCENRTSIRDSRDGVVLILRVENVDDVYEKLKNKGINFVTPPEDHKAWHCKMAHFRDPDGNLIELNGDL
ncbi:MAG: VOC family protein [Desulfobacterales bacterium]|nr:VOC family protein [Desulfobacterales bacterium]